MKSITEILRFIITGSMAAALHFAIVCMLVPCGFHPLTANLAAFLLAFQFSYLVHSLWTFSGKQGNYRKMFAVSCSAFIANEMVYAILLREGISYRISLLITLAIVSIGTYLASKCWVFTRSQA